MKNSGLIKGWIAIAAMALLSASALAAKPDTPDAKAQAGEMKDAKTCAGCALSSNTHKAELGKPAPAFALKDAEGTTHSLAALKGKIVVLTWFNPGCPFVQAHLKSATIENLAKKYDPAKVAFLYIDSTSPAMDGSAERDKKTAEEYKLKVPILLDPDGKTGRAYGASVTPDEFIVDAKGTLIYQGALDNSPLGRTPEKEKPVNYVSEVLDALLAGQKPPVESTKPYGCPVKYPTQ